MARNKSLKHFFFNDTATTEIYTLSLHDALPICLTTEPLRVIGHQHRFRHTARRVRCPRRRTRDRKSTRLNSSHGYISYAVFCLKKKIKVLNMIKLLSSKPTSLRLFNPTAANIKI